MKRVAWTGVLVGGLVDVVTSFVVSLPPLILFQVQLRHEHLSRQQHAIESLRLTHGVPYRIWALFVVCACSLLGGYIAAKLSDRDEVLNGGLSSLLRIVLSVAILSRVQNTNPIWLHVLYFSCDIVFSCIGGYLRLRQKRWQTLAARPV